MTAFDTTKI